MGKTAPIRSCVVTGEEHPQGAMLRFVRAPNGEVVADLYNKLPGKGAWVLLDHAILQQAYAKNPFSRAFKEKTSIPERGLEVLKNAVTEQFYATLSLMRRAGSLVFGFENTRKLLQSAKTGVYLTASNAGTDSRKTLEKLGASLTVIDGLHPARLGQVCGQDETMHAAISDPYAFAQCMMAYKRLCAVCGLPQQTASLDVKD